MASILRPTANRQVHLLITPRLSNLGESREVLRLISQFGEVEYFKSLKYDPLTAPNAALVVFKDEEAARHCVHKSPIRFRMGKAPVEKQKQQEPEAVKRTSRTSKAATPSSTEAPTTTFSPFGVSQSRSMSTTTTTTTTTTTPIPRAPSQQQQQQQPERMPFQAPPPPMRESRIFQIRANPARIIFRNHIEYGHYYGNFALDTKSVPQTDLMRSVPVAGLSCVDWRAEDRPWRIATEERRGERTGPGRRKRLRELYEEGPSKGEEFGEEA
ncbi:Hypothetical predicted protein [Lecanosticta acicola]|uniref:RRM domain-containing protein n=1 Tax=Lecanosticta acicola TaxID=111012 RepID=A0AAI8YR89_9PEZI|nr:Hypothetical predicted protein [Lecanosticta acicola]